MTGFPMHRCKQVPHIGCVLGTATDLSHLMLHSYYLSSDITSAPISVATDHSRVVAQEVCSMQVLFMFHFEFHHHRHSRVARVALDPEAECMIFISKFSAGQLF